MRKKAIQTPGTGSVQVFELTMDNPEDQDELNRRLRKPGEPDSGPSPQVAHSVPSEVSPARPCKKKGQGKGNAR